MNHLMDFLLKVWSVMKHTKSNDKWLSPDEVETDNGKDFF